MILLFLFGRFKTPFLSRALQLSHKGWIDSYFLPNGGNAHIFENQSVLYLQSHNGIFTAKDDIVFEMQVSENYTF